MSAQRAVTQHFRELPTERRPPPALAAEESGAGKQILLERGAYNDMDVCIMYVAKPPPLLRSDSTKMGLYRCHPAAGETQEVGFVSSLAMQSLWAEYFGQTYAPALLSTRFPPNSPARMHRSAHAGFAPWDGVNALDAAFVAYAGISALRQQIRPEQRVHGVISGRDWAPNGSYHLPKTNTPPIPTRKKAGGRASKRR